ncbi:MAG: hypothetical protein NTX20_05880 [Verrucomicrobia bacterium]|nr:hypothetical protein [Verrucomicrobiota bacterium]
MKPLIPPQAIIPILLLGTITVLASTCGSAHAADKPNEKDKGRDHGAPVVKPAEPTKDAPTKLYPLKVCIVSDNDLDSMGEQASFVYQGQTIKVCCKPCIAKFEKNPAKYLKKLEGK